MAQKIRGYASRVALAIAQIADLLDAAEKADASIRPYIERSLRSRVIHLRALQQEIRAQQPTIGFGLDVTIENILSSPRVRTCWELY